MSAEFRQLQFLNVVDRDEAERRFRAALPELLPIRAETVSLHAALGRVLAGDVTAPIDVTGFDRSNVDGFAVRAADTAHASEVAPVVLRLNQESIVPGSVPSIDLLQGTLTPIATGGMIPRGAGAVVMVEDTRPAHDDTALVMITRSVASGDNLTFAGTDISRGEIILRGGSEITSREVGVMAALGLTEVAVHGRPRVAVLSTGNEIVAPGEPLPAGCVYDSNAAILCAAVRELGGEPVPLGVVNDDADALRLKVNQALECEIVVLSGGTSKGEGDISYRVVAELPPPGIVVHGVALKPGKPVCLAVSGSTPVIVLPGFPTSAVFTFHEFVAPLIREMAGRQRMRRETLKATLPRRVNSQRGRTEYLLVNLVDSAAPPPTTGSSAAKELPVAYPLGRGSGSVTTFSLADGFIRIPQNTEFLDERDVVDVQLLNPSIRPADLVFIGSHCPGVDLLMSELQRRGLQCKTMFVGSQAGLRAAMRGDCDVAGMHLFDEATQTYNKPFLSDGMTLIPGYRRQQGIVVRPGDGRFRGLTNSDSFDPACFRRAISSEDCVMVNRNTGSGTRVLIDDLLDGARPNGYAVQPKSHNAVCAAVVQGRADWGVAIESVAGHYDLHFIPLKEEHYDFVIPGSRVEQPAVEELKRLLNDAAIIHRLRELGLRSGEQTMPDFPADLLRG